MPRRKAQGTPTIKGDVVLLSHATVANSRIEGRLLVSKGAQYVAITGNRFNGESRKGAKE